MFSQTSITLESLAEGAEKIDLMRTRIRRIVPLLVGEPKSFFKDGGHLFPKDDLGCEWFFSPRGEKMELDCLVDRLDRIAYSSTRRPEPHIWDVERVYGSLKKILPQIVERYPFLSEHLETIAKASKARL